MSTQPPHHLRNVDRDGSCAVHVFSYVLPLSWALIPRKCWWRPSPSAVFSLYSPHSMSAETPTDLVRKTKILKLVFRRVATVSHSAATTSSSVKCLPQKNGKKRAGGEERRAEAAVEKAELKGFVFKQWLQRAVFISFKKNNLLCYNSIQWCFTSILHVTAV